MSTWTLELAGGAVLTLDAQTCLSVTRTRQNQAKDSMQIVVREQIEDIGALHRTVATVRRDGVVWFTGLILEPETAATPQTEGKTYNIVGGNVWLENKVCFQAWSVGNGDFESLPRYIFFARGYHGGGFTRLTVGAEVYLIVRDVQLAGAPIQVGAHSIDLTPPPTRAEGMTCAEALMHVLAWCPDATQWWDYSTELAGVPTPTYHVARFADLATVTVPFADLTSARIAPARMQRPDFIRFFLKTQAPPEDLESSVGYETSIEWVRVGTPPEAGSFFGLELMADAHQQEDGQMVDIPLLTTLASAYMAALQAPAWRGSITYVGRDGEPHAELRPGVKLRLGGSPRAEWETMDALVQSVTDDILTGTTTATVGPAGLFGPDQLRQLMYQWRVMLRIPSNEELKEQATGQTDDVNYGFGHDNEDRDPRRRRPCCCSSGSGGGA